jgi:hypothetical protein
MFFVNSFSMVQFVLPATALVSFQNEFRLETASNFSGEFRKYFQESSKSESDKKIVSKIDLNSIQLVNDGGSLKVQFRPVGSLNSNEAQALERLLSQKINDYLGQSLRIPSEKQRELKIKVSQLPNGPVGGNTTVPSSEIALNPENWNKEFGGYIKKAIGSTPKYTPLSSLIKPESLRFSERSKAPVLTYDPIRPLNPGEKIQVEKDLREICQDFWGQSVKLPVEAQRSATQKLLVEGSQPTTQPQGYDIAKMNQAVNPFGKEQAGKHLGDPVFQNILQSDQLSFDRRGNSLVFRFPWDSKSNSAETQRVENKLSQFLDDFMGQKLKVSPDVQRDLAKNLRLEPFGSNPVTNDKLNLDQLRREVRDRQNNNSSGWDTNQGTVDADGINGYPNGGIQVPYSAGQGSGNNGSNEIENQIRNAIAEMMKNQLGESAKKLPLNYFSAKIFIIKKQSLNQPQLVNQPAKVTEEPYATGICCGDLTNAPKAALNPFNAEAAAFDAAGPIAAPRFGKPARFGSVNPDLALSEAYSEAVRALKAFESGTALIMLEHLLAKDAGDGILWQMKAVALYDLGRDAEAQDCARKGYKLLSATPGGTEMSYQALTYIQGHRRKFLDLAAKYNLGA